MAEEKPDVKPDGEVHIQIKVKSQDNKELTFKVKRSTPFSKIIRKWCEQMAQEESTVRFMFDGQPVNPTDSPHSLELEEGDTIDVMTAQTGGALSSH